MKMIHFAPIMPHPVPRLSQKIEVVQPVKPQGGIGVL